MNREYTRFIATLIVTLHLGKAGQNARYLLIDPLRRNVMSTKDDALLKELALEEYKYGFSTDIEMDIAPRGLTKIPYG